MTTTPIAIRSIGPPPQKHADRVIAEMMHALARKYSTLLSDVSALVGPANDGNPRGQEKLAQRIKNLHDLMKVSLKSGKRGKYKIFMYALTGWDPRHDNLILMNDPVPERPWLACQVCVLKSFGNGRNHRELNANTFVLISHHALSRAAQRLELRTIDAIPVIARAILHGALELLIEKGTMEAWLAAPPQGWRITIDEDDAAIVVLKKHETLKVLIAATMFERGEEE